MFIAYMMLGAGIAAGTIAPAAFVVANWFGGRRGLAMGVTASYVIAHWGWRTAYLVFAPVFLIVIPSVLMVVRSRPPGERRMSVAERPRCWRGSKQLRRLERARCG